MLEIKEYVKAETLAQAYELNQKKTNQIIGGMLWMKLGDHRIQTAIDLSGLGLDTIEETPEEFSIGCMVSLRQLELHEGLEQWTQGAVRESVCHIVGVQFRNLATVGGSLYGRYGFSDVLTCFLVLDAYVELYKGGIIPLEQIVQMPKDNDILVRVIVKKTPGRYAYLSHRNTKTDFPVLTCAVSADEKGVRAAIGARPGKAMLVPIPGIGSCFGKEEAAGEAGVCCGQDEAVGEADVCCGKNEAAGEADAGPVETAESREERLCVIAERIAEQIPMGSNMRASAQYRTHLVKVLLKRGFQQLLDNRENT